MGNNKIEYFDFDGLYRAKYKPITIEEYPFGKKLPRGRLTIFDANSGKKLFSCIVPRNPEVADKIFDDFCIANKESSQKEFYMIHEV